MTAVRCEQCGTAVAPGMLACPSCRTLVHAGRLKELAGAARGAQSAGDVPGAMARWREALELLPRDTRQYATIAATLEDLGKLPAAASAKPAQPSGNWLQRSGAAAVAVVVLLLTKGKFLLAGLLKLPTLFTMLAAFGVYLTIFGWKFALGLVVTIYVHEMGHVAALVRYGVAASPPMFIPGLGAFVRMKQHLPSPGHDARVGLAGPLWGFGAGIACYAIGKATGSDIWLALADVTAFLNLFNLIPIWQLDGGRAFHAFSTRDRWIATAIAGIVWAVSHEGMVLLVALVAGWQAWRKNEVPSDKGALALFAFLVIGLAVLGWAPVPIPTR